MRAALALKRGRPTDPLLDAVAQMCEQGMSVKEILRHQSRGYDRLDAYG